MGIAQLPDGTKIDYNEYIRSHPHWQKVRKARYEYDNHQCVICHTELQSWEYETHHMTYIHLGNEHMRDVVTLCKRCHTIFHNNWKRQDFWRGRENDHWTAFSLSHTARLCAAYYAEDRLISKDIDGPNLCSQIAQRELIDRYMKEFEILEPVLIDPNDIGLFVRNKRYELFFEAEGRGLSVEEFLDEYYGHKVRGKNPIRQEAGKKNGTFDHKPANFHRHYKENANLNILMKEAKKYERGSSQTYPSIFSGSEI